MTVMTQASGGGRSGSLYDVIEKATGVKVKERVPDHLLTQADEVVNVDVSAEWYFSSNSILAGTIFHKKVDDYILVTTRKEGSSVIYAIRDPALVDLLAVAKRVLINSLAESQELLTGLRHAAGER